jgi:hypothetical protein
MDLLYMGLAHRELDQRLDQQLRCRCRVLKTFRLKNLVHHLKQLGVHLLPSVDGYIASDEGGQDVLQDIY